MAKKQKRKEVAFDSLAYCDTKELAGLLFRGGYKGDLRKAIFEIYRTLKTILDKGK